MSDRDDEFREGMKSLGLDEVIPTALIIDLKSPNLSFRWT